MQKDVEPPHSKLLVSLQTERIRAAAAAKIEQNAPQLAPR
jgi:hypothetical protein